MPELEHAFSRGTYFDFDDELKPEFGLVHISEEEFDRAIEQGSGARSGAADAPEI